MGGGGGEYFAKKYSYITLMFDVCINSLYNQCTYRTTFRKLLATYRGGGRPLPSLRDTPAI